MSESEAIRNYSFLVVFANDDRIDAGELAKLEELALRDGVVDDEEKETLQAIFSRVTREEVEPEVWAEMESFRTRYGF